MPDHALQFLDALLVGGDLGAQVGNVGDGIAGRVPGAGEEADRLRLPQRPVLDQQPVVDQHALFLDGG